MSSITLTVDGKPVTVDLAVELQIGVIGTDMQSVAAQMAYWGSVWASAESERIRVEAYYRQWSALKRTAMVSANPKLAEWRVHQEIQALPEYLKMYGAQAEAAKNAILAKSVFEAYRVKANMLQSKGAMLRAELDSTGMNTPSKVGTGRAVDKDIADGSRQEMINKMKSTFKKKKKVIG